MPDTCTKCSGSYCVSRVCEGCIKGLLELLRKSLDENVTLKAQIAELTKTAQVKCVVCDGHGYIGGDYRTMFDCSACGGFGRKPLVH